MVLVNKYWFNEITGEKKLLYHNGQIGYFEKEVVATSEEDGGEPLTYLQVRTSEGKIIQIMKEPFEKYEYDKYGEKITLITATQYPVRLAYAMSIHKSQGQTIDKVHVNCRRIFAPGQFYVALSRCSNPDGITFSNFHYQTHLKTDERGRELYGKP
jgi:ATP-dependent exoDNAse (exonuclease V) alpha subunit